LWNLLGPWRLGGGLWQPVGQGLLVGEEQLGRFLGRGWLREVGARPQISQIFLITGVTPQKKNSVGINKHLGH